jgi:predicted RNase H-like HicB family nuclease
VRCAIEAIEVHLAGLGADSKPIPEKVGQPQPLTATIAD